jgi:hypothetical protein
MRIYPTLYIINTDTNKYEKETLMRLHTETYGSQEVYVAKRPWFVVGTG